MKIKNILFLTVVLCILLSACGQASAPTAYAELTWQEQYDLGVRYLSEGNYEEAIIAFSAAIEIDPKRPEAYVGRGDSYAAQGQQLEEIEAAYELYQKALADYERAVELGSTETQEKLNSLNDAIQQLQARENAEPLLKELYPLMDSGALEEAKALMRQEDYRAMSAAAGESCFTYSETEGICLAVYKDNCYYFGEWDSGQRKGTGLWMQAAFDDESTVESRQYNGTWSNDLPNGEGEIIRVSKNSLQWEDGSSTSVNTTISGTFKDGFYHGTIYETWVMNTGETWVWSPITAIDGIYQPMPDVPQEMLDRSYYEENIAAGKSLVAVTEEGTDLWTTNGSVYRVFGFDEE